MKSEEQELKDTDIDTTTEVEHALTKSARTTAAQIVTADSVQAEEVPTIPLGSLQTISTLQPEITIHSVAATRAVSMPTPLVVQPEEYRRNIGEWFQIWREGVRPAYLPLALMPVLLGSVLGWSTTVTAQMPLGHMRWAQFIGAFIGVTFIQLGANLVNDYYDYIRGIDTGNTFGPGGLIQQGMIKPSNVLKYGLAFLGIGALIGLFIAQSGGPLVYLFGLIGVFCAFFYSATARALSSLVSGELVSFIIFGPLITAGAYMMQTGGKITSTPFIYSIPLGLLIATVIHVNNIRDTESDVHAGKRTLASLLGLRLSRVLFIALVVIAYGIIVAVAIPHKAPHLILITFWTLPTLTLAITGVLRTDTPAGFNQVISQMLKVITFFAIWLVIATIVLTLIPVWPHLPEHLLPGL